MLRTKGCLLIICTKCWVTAASVVAPRPSPLSHRRTDVVAVCFSAALFLARGSRARRSEDEKKLVLNVCYLISQFNEAVCVCGVVASCCQLQFYRCLFVKVEASKSFLLVGTKIIIQLRWKSHVGPDSSHFTISLVCGWQPEQQSHSLNTAAEAETGRRWESATIFEESICCELKEKKQLQLLKCEYFQNLLVFTIKNRNIFRFFRPLLSVLTVSVRWALEDNCDAYVTLTFALTFLQTKPITTENNWQINQ